MNFPRVLILCLISLSISLALPDNNPTRFSLSAEGTEYENLKSDRFPFDSLNIRFIANWPFGPSYTVSADSLRNLIFVGSGGGIYLLDVSNPANPQKISEIYTRGFVWDIFYDTTNQRLFVADGQCGLEIWNVADPRNPFKLGYYFTPNYAYGVYISGSYAYVADYGDGLRIIDISNPSNPFEVGYCDTPGLAWDVVVSGHYAYIADER
ncbi:MAG: hypothetical protein ABIJ94_03945, partial [candidate division WOR-3 bacterium]